MADPKDGLTVTYQGVICTPEYDYVRNVGLEPDFGFVHILASNFTDFRLREPAITVGDQPISTRDRTPEAPPDKTSFITQGELVISERIGGEEFSVTFASVPVTDRAMESVIAFDDESAVIRIEISDIRYRWREEGVVFAWINIPKQGNGQPGKDKGLPGRGVDGSGGSTVSDPAGPSAGSGAAPDSDPNTAGGLFGGAFNKLLDSPGQSGGGDPLSGLGADISQAADFLGFGDSSTLQTFSGGPAGVGGGQRTVGSDYTQGSLNNGAPWTLIQVIQTYILPNLYGRPRLKRIPDDVKDRIVSAKVWDGILTKKAFKELLDEFRLVVALNPDASIGLWHENEGDLQDEKFNIIKATPTDLDCDPRVSNRRRLIGLNTIPQSVLVLGPPILETARVTGMEPCGEIGGRIVPLDIFLKNINLNMDQAKTFAFATHDERSTFFKVDADGLRRFGKCAFKWYRLPGGARDNADRLPILARGRCDSIGQLLPPRVWTESLQVCNAAALIKQKLGDGKLTASKALNALLASKAINYKLVTNLGYLESDGGYEIDAEQGIVKFDEIQGVVGGTVEGSNGGKTITGNEAAAGRTGSTLVTPPGGATTEKAGASVEGVALQEAFLARPARVGIEFGFLRKPSRVGNVSVEHRYYSFWLRESVERYDNSPSKASVRKIAALPPDALPFVIYRDDLQQVIAVDGGTNKGLLDAVAERLAKEVLQVAPITYGGIVKIHRPVPLINTGLVKSISWGTNAGVPTGRVPAVIAHVGTVEPFAPKPDLRTRAKTAPDDFTIKDHVLAPKGLTR